MTSKLTPITPGEILKEEFLVPHGISATRLAIWIRVPGNRVSDIVRGKRAITADTALRLSRAFGTTAEFWLNLQARYEIEVAKDAKNKDIAKIDPIAA